MFIDTSSKDSLRAGLSDCLNIPIPAVEERVLDAGRKAEAGMCFDTVVFYEEMEKLLQTYTPEILDKISFYHMSRRLISETNNGGYSLYHLLLSKNEISDFLNTKDFEFKAVDDRVVPLYKGRQLIPLEDSNDARINYLKLRLGYFQKRKDFCFNGFAFKEHLIKNQYAKILVDGPEFMVKLAEYVNAPAIINDYKDISKFYCIRYDVPFDMVIFDGYDNLQNSEKQIHYLKACLLRMLDDINRTGRESDSDNIIIRLRDDCSMSDKYYIQKEIIKDEAVYG